MKQVYYMKDGRIAQEEFQESAPVYFYTEQEMEDLLTMVSGAVSAAQEQSRHIERMTTFMEETRTLLQQAKDTLLWLVPSEKALDTVSSIVYSHIRIEDEGYEEIVEWLKRLEGLPHA